jgi:hypothetical protein
MATSTTTPGFPWGMTILFVLAVLIYGPFIANVLTARSSDLAGRGMSLGFAVIQGLVLWIVLGSMLAIAILRGAMPSYATAAAIVFLPLSAIAAASAMGLYNDRYGDWLGVVPALLPLLLALYAFWARMVGWHGTLPPVPTTAILGGAIVVLTVVPLVLTTIEYMPNPERDAAQAAERKTWEEQEKKRVEEADAADAARFAKLGPDSPLRDYLEDLPPGAIHHRQALAGARLVKTRTTDAVQLLGEDRLSDLSQLWALDIEPSAVCVAYREALQAEAAKIAKTRSDYISVAIDLERQLPNIEWLTGKGCDLSGPLSDAANRVRSVSDSERLTEFADQLMALGKRR